MDTSGDTTLTSTGTTQTRTTTTTRKKRIQKPKHEHQTKPLPAIPKAKMGAPNRHPWEDIRQAYIEGIKNGDDITLPSLKEVAEQFKAPYVRVRERSSKERWGDRRQAYQVQITRERQAKRSKSLAKSSIEFDSKAHDVAKLGIAMVTTRLAEVAQEVQRIKSRRDDAHRRLEQGLPVDRHELFSAVHYKELDGLASAAQRFQEIGMKALGTDVQRHEVTGADGEPLIEGGKTINIIGELNRDDPERLAMLISALQEAGLSSEMEQILPSQNFGTDQNTIDAEVVEEKSTELDSDSSEEEEEVKIGTERITTYE